MGGKSKSSTSASTTSYANQAEQSADGFIGSGANVYNLSSGTSISLSTIDQFPEGVENIAMALLDLVGETVSGARDFATESLNQVSTRVQEQTQPDLTVVKYTPYIIGGLVLIAGIAIFVGRK